ncbi:MAG: ABC-2 family transporter protein [Planctomycetota bacterium]
MLRYLRLYLQFLKFSFSRSLEYRMDFWFRIVMDCMFYAVELIFFTVLYQHTNMLGGWNYDQVLIFVSGYLVIDAIHMTIVSNNMWWLPIYVNKGDLDYYIVRPVSSLFFLSLRDFAANSFLNLLIAGGILTWSILRYPGELGTANLLWFLFLILNGSFLHYIMQMFFQLPVFWTHANRGLMTAFFSAARLMERPDKIFTGWTHKILTTIFPMLLVIALPARVLFDGPDPLLIAHILGVTAIAFLTMRSIWYFALRHYSSASS